MDLYILRHAIAADRGRIASDAKRPLTDEGRERLRRTTQAWEGLGVIVDRLITSPYLRAHQTAEIAAEALGLVDVDVCEALAAGASPAEMIAALAERCTDRDRVMVVGHEPDLGRLISTLVSGDDEAGFRMKKAGLSKLTVDSLHAGRCGVLEWHLWPRHMLKMVR